tara:strand:- start:531 stop:824 length:294 start_codon:yes stop_codon:yes gene_type:complete
MKTFYLKDIDHLRQLEEKSRFPFPSISEEELEKNNEEGEHVETLFVDSSGLGQSWEPALTFNQFVSKLEELITEHKEGLHLAITSVGQFQVYIDVWK